MTVFGSLLSLPGMDSVLKINQTSGGWLIFSKSKSYNCCNISFISVGYRVRSGSAQRLANSIFGV